MEIRHHTRLQQARPVLCSGRLGIAGRLTAVSCLVLFTVPAFGQSVLYDNGPDSDSGYYGVNFGATTINSFELSEEAILSNVTVTLYDVDDRNVPKVLAWTISTEPTGGTVLGSGFVELSQIRGPISDQVSVFRLEDGLRDSKAYAAQRNLLSRNTTGRYPVEHQGILGGERRSVGSVLFRSRTERVRGCTSCASGIGIVCRPGRVDGKTELALVLLPGRHSPFAGRFVACGRRSRERAHGHTGPRTEMAHPCPILSLLLRKGGRSSSKAALGLAWVTRPTRQTD